MIGTSAGGMFALQQLFAQLPKEFPAPVMVVQHMRPDNDGRVLVEAINDSGALRCKLARNGERFKAGHIYVAPPDNHLLVKATTLLVTKGARENRYRPAIDPMFRSAAVTHGPRVISVVLTGLLDDGTEGTVAVRRCGGTTVVQEPREAAYAEMPQSALNTKVDHCVPVRQMGALLDELARKRAGKRKPVPEDILIEATIAERVLSDVQGVNQLGKQVPYNCPGCGGVLWEVTGAKTLRYRCHTGHSYSAATLLSEQSGKIEETLWITLRMLEERRNLLRAMRARGKSSPSREREQDTEVHIARIRSMLIAGGRANAS
ncbi:MAG: CheB methylesterase [Myxococcaceae bacterium]|nr:CheB methylesterase [Myxococcaceae bacterium]